MHFIDCIQVNAYHTHCLMIFEPLYQFRQTLHSRIEAGRDSLFELMNAVLMSPNLRSFMSLSQHPIFRRQRSSTYSKLHDGRIHRDKLHRY